MSITNLPADLPRVETGEERQHVNIVYYNEQNEMNQRILGINADGTKKWNYTNQDVLHIIGSIGHVSYEWTLQIFFICFLTTVDHYEYIAAPIVAIISYFICYAGYWFDKPRLFIVTIVVEAIVGFFYLGFGIVLSIEVSYTDNGISSILCDATTENTLALAIYFIINVPINLLFIFVLFRAFKRGYSLFYWAPTMQDETFTFRVVLFGSIFAIIIMSITLIAVKLVYRQGSSFSNRCSCSVC